MAGISACSPLVIRRTVSPTEYPPSSAVRVSSTTSPSAVGRRPSSSRSGDSPVVFGASDQFAPIPGAPPPLTMRPSVPTTNTERFSTTPSARNAPSRAASWSTIEAGTVRPSLLTELLPTSELRPRKPSGRTTTSPLRSLKISSKVLSKVSVKTYEPATNATPRTMANALIASRTLRATRFLSVTRSTAYRAPGWTRPLSYAKTAACTRSRTPSLVSRWPTWVFTVVSLTTSSRGDLRVGQATRDQLEHLAARVRSGSPGRRGGGVGGRQPRGEPVEQPPRDARRDDRLAVGDDPDRGDEVFGRHVLEQEPAGAGAQRLAPRTRPGRTSSARAPGRASAVGR